MHSHEARGPCYKNARHVPGGGGVRKCAGKFKFDCFAGARNVVEVTKLSDFGHPENTDPPGCKYRYYAKRLALKLSLSIKFRKV